MRGDRCFCRPLNNFPVAVVVLVVVVVLLAVAPEATGNVSNVAASVFA